MKRLFIILAFLYYGLYLSAQGLFESTVSETEEESSAGIELKGYARGSVMGKSKNYDYSSVFGEFNLQGKLSQNKTILFADLRFRSGLSFGNEYTSLQIKEAYAGYTGEKFDVLLGNQIVTWGRTDGFNPTNNITPNDYFFLTAEPDDQKLSNFMLRMKYRFNSQVDIDLIGIPFYKQSVYRFDLFDMGQNADFEEISLPDKSFEKSTLAARINFEMPAIGFSLSYFRGYDPFYGFNINTVNWITMTPFITYSPKPYLKNTAGADFDLPLSNWIIRGEFACNITSDYEDSMYIPKPDLAFVVGIERDFSGFHTILQYIGKYTLDYSEPEKPVLFDTTQIAQFQYANEMIWYESAVFNSKIFRQEEELNHAVSLTVSKSFAYETWNVELNGYYNLTSEEYLFRPKIACKVTDALTISLGASHMDGPDKSIFSYSAPVLNGAFLELKANF